jgi:hypothetical protein
MDDWVSKQIQAWDLLEGARKLLKERNIVWQVEFHLDQD